MASSPLLPPGMALSAKPLPQIQGQIPAFNPALAPVGPGQGFQTYAAAPSNNLKVQSAMTPPNARLQPGATGGTQMASVNPPHVDTAGLSAAVTAPMPQLNHYTPPTATPTQQEDMLNNPNQYRKAPGKLGTILQMVASGLAGANGAMVRDPNAGVRVAQRFAQQDAAIPGENLATYRARIVQPGIDASNLARTQAETSLTNANATAIPARIEANQDKIDAALAQHGLIRDANGNIAPDTNSPVYQQQQIKNDALQAQAAYMQAGQQLREAQAALANAKNDPSSPAYRQAQQQQDRLTAMLPIMKERADSYMGRYLESAYGRGINGEVLPGAILTNSGQPVGTAFAVNVRPTGQQRNKANMATSAGEQLDDIVSILKKNPSMFGPGYGQSTQFKKWIGTQSPDAQRFAAARTIAADHLAATFGGRSEAALAALDKAIGEYKDNPQAAIAGIRQLEKANKVFQGAGRYQTVGGNPSNPTQPPGGGTEQGGKTDFIYVPGKGLVAQ